MSTESTSAIEARSIDYVPKNERHAKLSSQFSFWFLGNFHFFTVAIGFIGPSMGLSTFWTFVAGALGIMLGTIFMAFHGSQGPEMGLPQMIQSRAQFGYRGVILALMATLFVFVGFNVVNITLLMSGLSTEFGISPMLICFLTVSIGAILAIFGHDWMHKFFKYALLLSLPIYGVLTLAAVFGWISIPVQADAVPAQELGFNWVAFATQFAVAAGYNISYAPYVSDYSRYLPHNTNRAQLIARIFLGASISGAWMIGLGAWLAVNLKGTDALVALGQLAGNLLPGSSSIVVALLALVFLPIIALNAYSAMLTVLTGVDSLISFKHWYHMWTLSFISAEADC